jgi:CheY-like chemotaxis protein
LDAKTNPEAEFCRQLSEQLHELKNRLWPITMFANGAPAPGSAPEITELMERILRDAQAALAISTRMSELVDGYSHALEPVKIGRQSAEGRSSAVSNRRLRILCVDNDADVRGALDSLLKHIGHHVDSACSGAEGLRIFDSDSYDLVITDSHLPDMSGRDLTRKLRARGPTPVIWLGHIDLENAPRIPGAADSPSAILTKPLSLSSLRKALAKVAPGSTAK